MNLVWLKTHNLQKTFLLVTAYVCSKVLRRDLQYELARLEQQKKQRTYTEIIVTLVVIFTAALLASSFGWMGLMLYFIIAIVLFR